jgi:hypothetical protein
MRIIFFTGFFILSSFISFSQQINSRLKFEKGQTVTITVQMKSFITQHTGGQAIDFSIEATGIHSYKVTSTTSDSIALHHQFRRINFKFDGWGKKMNFDSENETDLNGIFGKPIKDMLDKTYDVTVDNNGKVVRVAPGKIELPETDGRMAIINSLMKDIFDLVQPPQKDKPSFFKVLPDAREKKYDAWTVTQEINGGKEEATYSFKDINDSTIIIDFTKNSSTVIKAEMMGSENVTSMTHKSTGKIILDRLTGILKEKTETIESNGNTVSSVGTLPVTSKTSITITVGQ